MDSASQNGNKSQNGGLIDGWCVNGDDVGTGFMPIVTPTLPLMKASELVVHMKASRRVASYLGISIGDRELDALAIVSMWCWSHRREGGPIDRIVSWSGYTRRWKAKVYSGMRDCVALNLLEFIPVAGGKRLCMTTKGHRMLDVYQLMYDKVVEEIQSDYVKASIKREQREQKEALIKSLRAA